jgi:hypothetical protein
MLYLYSAYEKTLDCTCFRMRAAKEVESSILGGTDNRYRYIDWGKMKKYGFDN